ncbi:MAG: PAC2 family protein [Candidatus ainarchaeum sp.]|nr:PAC2 family protein [Candidatus ainarchaeum sp.]
MTVEIMKTASFETRNPLIIVGFPGIGLVGSVATAYFVEKNGFEMVGYVTSNDFAPLAAIHNYKPLPPVRIYFSKSLNIMVIMGEIVVPVSISNDLAHKIMEFAGELKATRIISVGGISMRESESAVYLVGNEQSNVDSFVSKKLGKSIKEGATTGVTGTLLAVSGLSGYSMLAVLAEASPDFVDPKAASNALQVLSKIISVPINTLELEKEARTLAQGAKESAIKSKALGKKGGPEGGMYG